MAKLFKIQCTECGYTKNVLDGSTRSLVYEYFTVACYACSSIENRSYDFPENRPVRPEPASGWWGRKKRQKEIDDRYLTESAQWSADLDKRRAEALQQPCSQCGSEVHRVSIGDPFIEPISINISCLVCKCQDCMMVTLEAMID